MGTLVLFDLDKTLLKSTQSHHKAFSEAFRKIYGVYANVDDISHQGMTDQQIIIEVLKKKGISEEDIKLNLGECIKEIEWAFNRYIKSEEIILLPGVRETLSALSKRKVLMSLVTGNLEPIARAKIRKARISNYFNLKIGGFGSDRLIRSELIALAVKCAKEKGLLKSGNNVFFIGDSALDIKSGKAAGVKIIGVATGNYSKKQLNDAGADYVVDNMNEILEIIG